MELQDTKAPFPADSFADVLEANREFAEEFEFDHLTGKAARGLGIVTCMDSRISPLAVVGMEAGDAKILRNAGARVTDDVLRTLVLAVYLLGVERILVMPHTNCKMASATEAQIHEVIYADYGVDTRSLEFRTTPDQLAALHLDVMRIRANPFIPDSIVVAGAVYDVVSGKLTTVDC